MTDPLNALAAHASDARRMLAQDKDPSRVTVAALAEGVPALVAELDEVRAEARRVLAHAVTYNWHEADTSYTEAVLSRGDRRIGELIRAIWRRGGYLESWSEGFDLSRWIESAALPSLTNALMLTSSPRTRPPARRRHTLNAAVEPALSGTLYV